MAAPNNGSHRRRSWKARAGEGRGGEGEENIGKLPLQELGQSRLQFSINHTAANTGVRVTSFVAAGRNVEFAARYRLYIELRSPFNAFEPAA